MSAKSFKTYKRTLAAGETDVINASGTFCRNMAASDSGLEIKVDDGVRFQLNEGEKFRVETGFTNLRITNTSGASITFELLIGEGDFDGSSLVGTVSINDATPVNVAATGNVNVTDDTLYDRSNAGEEFAGYGNDAGAASQYSRVGLHNPTGSGKIVVLNKLIMMSTNSLSDGYLYVGHGARLADGSTGNSKNKKLDGVAPSAIIERETSASITGWTELGAIKRLGAGLANYNNNTHKIFEVLTPADSPLIIPEGYTVFANPNATNAYCTNSFEWSEY